MLDPTTGRLPDQFAPQAALDAASEAQTYAAGTKALQDLAVSSLLDDPASSTAVALRRDATEMVGIGDSWMQGTGADTGKSFMEIVSKHLGVSLHRYSIGGTGFNNQGTAGNGRYDNQAATAAADTSYDHAHVRRVVIDGGTNDWGDKATAGTVTQSVCDTLRASFPNARLLFVLCTGQGGKKGGAGLRPAVNRGAFDTIERIAKANDADVLRGDYWINSLSPDGFNLGDGLHPGPAGHEFIAGQIISFLESGNTGKNTILNNNATRNFITWTPNAITPTGDLIAYDIGGGLLYLAGQTTFTLPALGTSGIGYDNPKYSLCTLGSQGRFIDGFGVSYPNTPVIEIPAYLNDGASTPGYANSRARVTINSYGASGNNLDISIYGQIGQVKPGTAIIIVWTGIILPLHGFAYSTS
jgi:lysophospholipase L1-like esterase